MKLNQLSWILLLSLTFVLLSLSLHAQDLTISEKIVARFTGPFHLRFVFQPIMAIVLGLKDGKTDALENRPPYLYYIFSDGKKRKEIIKHGLISVAKVLTIGVILDIGVQIYLFSSVRIWGAILVGFVVIALPYALARGIRNRLTKTS